MRALLVHCGTLPDLDRQLLDFEAWLDPPPERARRATRTSGCCASSGSGTSSPGCAPKPPGAADPAAQTYAQLEFIHATAFCTWLAEHVHRPTELGQDDLDRYYTALKIGHRQALRGFLNWAMNSHNLPSLTFTRTRFTTGEAVTQTVARR